MSESAFFETTFTPDYGEMFAVQRRAARYHYSSGQRYVWWGYIAIYIGLIGCIAYWGDVVERALTPLLGEDIAFWSPIALMVILGASAMALFRWLSLRYSARWLEQRKPSSPTAFAAGPDGLSWQSEDIESRVGWRPIERIFLTPEALCFLCGAVTLYVPRRVFCDALELKAFLDKAIPALGDEARRLTEADPTVQTARGV